MLRIVAYSAGACFAPFTSTTGAGAVGDANTGVFATRSSSAIAFCIGGVCVGAGSVGVGTASCVAKLSYMWFTIKLGAKYNKNPKTANPSQK